VRKPYPKTEEVQILFTIDTNPWKNMIAPKGEKVSFKGPLRIKIGSMNWELTEMRDDGLGGDEKAGDGIYSLVINIPKSTTGTPFAFDDASGVRGKDESLAMELIKKGLGNLPEFGNVGHPSFTADTIKRVDITREHFERAVSGGFIKVGG
jgi:hypothetical protein